MDGLVTEPKSKVLVTGASGFVGTHLLRVLTEQGYSVTAISRRASGPAAYERISWNGEAIGVHLAETNVVSAVETAGEAGRERALALAEKLVALPVRRWVYLSSAAVYGDQSEHPHLETDPVAEATSYARQKLAVENVFLEKGHVVVRSANLYGPGMSAENVLSRLLGQLPEARTRRSFRVKSTSPVRDYLHVEDLALGIAKILASDAAGIYNLGTGRPTSVGELCKMVAKAAGIASCAVESETADVKKSHLVLSSEKARVALGWAAKTSLELGLRTTVGVC